MPSAWVATTAVTLVLLGPTFALVRAALEPVLRVLTTGRPLSPRLSDLAPRAALVLPSYAAGVVLSLVAEAGLPRGVLETTAFVALPAAIATAHVVPVGPAGASVIAAVLIHKGLPPSAGLAFLLTSAAAAPRSSWRRRAVILAGLGAICALAGTVLPASAGPSLHDLGAHRHPTYEWIAGGVLVAWTVAELVRQGPRGSIRAALSRSVMGDSRSLIKSNLGLNDPHPTGGALLEAAHHRSARRAARTQLRTQGICLAGGDRDEQPAGSLCIAKDELRVLVDVARVLHPVAEKTPVRVRAARGNPLANVRPRRVDDR